MTVVAKQLAQKALTTLPVVLYTAPAVPVPMKALLKDLNIANSSDTPVSVFLHIVPNGGAPSADTVLLPGVSVPAKGLIGWYGTQVLEAGHELMAWGSDVGLTLTASGAEIS